MVKYIDAEKLIAEIERKIGICEQQRNDAIEVECYNLADDASARMGELRVLLETITSLQQEQPEVDLEKEIDRYFEPIRAVDIEFEPFTQMAKCARHFYELGKNARKL